jgi:multidrug transporter EmrE-like cation transporter
LEIVIMSDFAIGNLFLFIAMIGGAAGQLLLKQTMTVLGKPTAGIAGIASMPWSLGLPSGLLAMACLVASFTFWLLSLTRLDLSYAYTMACGSAAFVAVLSVVFLGETFSLRMAAGIALIVAGSALLVPVR